jgi:copper chaperone NosL
VNRRVFLLACGAVALAAACEKTDQAVDPVWGKEPCAHCRMLVSDRRFAAQAIDAAGDRAFFDDAGCLVLWLDEKRQENARAWVYQSSGWVDARKATYEGGAKTPMDHGFEARPGGAFRWEDVRGAVRVAQRRSER